MVADQMDLTSTEPLTILDRPDDPQTDPLRLEMTMYPASGTAPSGVVLPHNRWLADLSDEHVNPRWDEWFKVLEGNYRVVHDGTETTLSEGEEILLPANEPHRHWNPTGQPARVRFEARPGLRLAEPFEMLYHLAQDGNVNDDGFPHPLQFAVIQDAYPGYFYSTDLPRGLQRVLTRVMAPIGRALGYSAEYPGE